MLQLAFDCGCFDLNFNKFIFYAVILYLFIFWVGPFFFKAYGYFYALEIQQLPIFVTNVSITPKTSSLDLLVASKFPGIYVKSLLFG